MAPRRAAQQQASEAAARDALIDAVALDIIYEAARAATDETGAEVAAEVMAAAGLLPIGTQPHASKQALASTTPRQRSTGSASPKMPSAAQPHTAQHSPKRPSPCMLVRRTRRAHEGFALPSCRWHHLCRRTSRTVG